MALSDRRRTHRFRYSGQLGQIYPYSPISWAKKRQFMISARRQFGDFDTHYKQRNIPFKLIFNLTSISILFPQTDEPFIEGTKLCRLLTLYYNQIQRRLSAELFLVVF